MRRKKRTTKRKTNGSTPRKTLYSRRTPPRRTRLTRRSARTAVKTPSLTQLSRVLFQSLPKGPKKFGRKPGLKRKPYRRLK